MGTWLCCGSERIHSPVPVGWHVFPGPGRSASVGRHWYNQHQSSDFSLCSCGAFTDIFTNLFPSLKLIVFMFKSLISAFACIRCPTGV